VFLNTAVFQNQNVVGALYGAQAVGDCSLPTESKNIFKFIL
jgi:hypothetical protein